MEDTLHLPRRVRRRNLQRRIHTDEEITLPHLHKYVTIRFAEWEDEPNVLVVHQLANLMLLDRLVKMPSGGAGYTPKGNLVEYRKFYRNRMQDIGDPVPGEARWPAAGRVTYLRYKEAAMGMSLFRGRP